MYLHPQTDVLPAQPVLICFWSVCVLYNTLLANATDLQLNLHTAHRATFVFVRD
jgi:hypothetical protein